MNSKYSFRTRFLALLLSAVMVLGMFPSVRVSAEEYYEAEMDGEQYETLGEALAAVPSGMDAPEKTIKLLQEVTWSFEVGSEDGSEPRKIVLDQDGHVLKLDPAVGSGNAGSGGICVYPNSKLTLKNGQVQCLSSVGISNYGTLKLDSAVVIAGEGTTYGISNQGDLTLSGETLIYDGSGSAFKFGITNAPNDRISTDVVVKCASGGVRIGSMQIERAERAGSDTGSVVVNITDGTFDRVVEDGGSAVDVQYNISGGTIGASTAEELEHALKIVSNGATIKLMDDVTLGFDVGAEDGSVSRQIILDLGDKTLTTAPTVGSAGTKTNGIRVLAKSELTVKNGKIVSPDADGDLKVKVGLANYGKLTLQNVDVHAGSAVLYTINNRGDLTLSGSTTVRNGTGTDFRFAITNDPYEYIYSNRNAVLNVSDAGVIVGNVCVERYERTTTNAGGIELNISAGTFGTLDDDGGEFVNVIPGITGGVFANEVSDYVKDGYECVQTEEGSYQVQFKKLEQEPLVFENSTISVIFEAGKTLENPVSGGSTGKEITYEVVSGDSASVDAATGLVTLLRAGTSTIRATMAGDDTYKSVSAEYVLTVAPNDREASFTRESDTVYYGTATLDCPEITVSAGSGAVSYEVIEGTEIAAVDENGKLTFLDGGVGQVKVRATVAADDSYNSCSAVYTVTVEYLPAPEAPFEQEGKNGENGWFRGDMTVRAPGYTMSKTNSFDGEWVESLTYTEEGDYTDTVYLKDENGYITGAITMTVRIDRTAPADLEITYGDYSWYDEIKSIFGSSKNVKVYFHFTEEGSKPAEVAYSLDDGASYRAATFQNGEYFASVAPEYRGHIRFYVKDKAGWETRADADGNLLVVDSCAPGVSIAYTGKYDEETDENGMTVITTAEDVFGVTFTVSDENLDLQDADPTLTITDKNGNAVAADAAWTEVSVDGKSGKQATVQLTEESTYDVELICSDRSNETKIKMQIVVDRTPSELEVQRVTDPVRTVAGVSYYDAGKVSLNLVINEENFRSSRTGFEITYRDKTINAWDYEAYGISWDRSWNNNNDGSHTKGLYFSESAPEGTYTVRVSYREGSVFDPVYRYSEPIKFVIDRSVPGATITYHEDGETILTKVIERLGEMIGFGKQKVEVTIKATDSISDVHHLIYDIGDGVKNTVEAAELNNNSCTFYIEDEYRDKVSVQVFDMADNNVEVTSDETLIIDRSSATIGVGYSGAATGFVKDNGVKVYKTGSENFRLIFTVTQKNFDARAEEPVVEFRTEGIGQWKPVAEEYLTYADLEADEEGNPRGTVTVAMPAEVMEKGGKGDYEFRCTYALFEGWEYGTNAMAVVRFDNDPPEISQIYDTSAIVQIKNGVMFFYDKQQVTIQIKEKNFDASDVRLKVEYKAAAADAYQEQPEWAEMAVQDNQWIHGMDNVHTMILNFTDEGHYKLQVSCTDELSTESTNNIADEFVIDMNDPTVPTITYETEFDWIEVFLGELFGFPVSEEKQVVATLSSEDVVSGIDCIEVSVDGREFEKTVKNADGTYSYTMDEGFRGKLTVRATDGAARTNEIAEIGTIVVDAVGPEIEAEYSANFKEYEGIPAIYTNADEFPVGFVVRDANYDLRENNAVVTLNGETLELTWTDGTVGDEPCGRSVLYLTEQGVYTFTASAVDRSNNSSDPWEKTVVVDRDEPIVELKFDDGQVQNPEIGTYYKTAQTVTIVVTETNFLPELVDVTLKRDGERVSIESEWVTEGDVHKLTFKIEEDAEYQLDVLCQDMAGNSTEDSSAFVLDQTAPKLEKIHYETAALARVIEEVTFGFYKAPVTVSVYATDATSGVKLISCKAEGTAGRDSTQEVAFDYAAEPDENGCISFELKQEFCGTITAQAEDLANNPSGQVNVGYDAEGKRLDKIVLDTKETERAVTVAPAPVRIVSADDMTDCSSYSEGEDKILYFNGQTKILVELTESNFFAENYQILVNGEKQKNVVWESNETVHTAEVTLSDDGDYLVTVNGKDYSGNQMVTYTSQRIVVDQDPPDIKISYFDDDGNPISESDLMNASVAGQITAHVVLKEHNFRAEDVQFLVTAKNSAGKDVLDLDENGMVKSYSEQGRRQNANGEHDDQQWSAFEMGTWRRKDDTYEIDLIFNADASFTFQVKYEDLAGNVVETKQVAFTVDNVDPVIIVDGINDDNRYCTDQTNTVRFRIQEENFTPAGVVFDYTITDAQGQNVELLTPWNETWVFDEEKGEWVMELVLSQEANYSFTLSYSDPSGRVGKVSSTGLETYTGVITMDRTVPQDVKISCDGVYHRDSAVVSMEATDATAGMMAFIISMRKDSGFSAANDWDLDENAWTVTVRHDEDLKLLNERLMYRGMPLKIHTENDKPICENGVMGLKLLLNPAFHGEISFVAVDLANNSSDNSEPVSVVVDNQPPVLSVELPEANTTEEDVLYYHDDSVTAKITLTEANFYEEDLVFTVNGKAAALAWNHDTVNQVHTANYMMSEEGDYRLALSYTDRSGNAMQSFTSKRIVIDRTAPAIRVDYDLNTPVSVYDGRAYYAAARQATVTVTERNFNAEDVKLTVSAKDINGKTVDGPAIGEWSSQNDIHTITLNYSNDANYTFDVAYEDKAGNAAKDYREDLFTVDKADPGNVSITYDKSVLEAVLKGITFGFYDAKMTVHLESHDITAGVQDFEYSYVTASGVSGVNSGKTNQRVEAKREGDKATASFQIPQSELKNGTQFNGTVTVTAVDRSGNRTTMQDDERIVVDNINPTVDIVYNAPVQTVGGTAYYADKISASIRINEANFYSNDVQVLVTRDGSKYPVTVSWSDQSLDVHTGTFTLDREGDYVVTVSYTDKSGNAMPNYVSGKMVIDQAAPVIHVSNVVANSANDDEIYTFSITVDDADGNMAAEDIDVVLSAVVRDENGKHVTERIDLGNAQVTAAGKTYVYTVKNLERDAIYTITCTAADLAGNTSNMIVLDDGQSYEQVRFSINRNGSTFTYGDDETEYLAVQYYVQNVEHDVVIHEINVDPVNSYTVSVNGVELKEGVDYTTTTTGGDKAWNLREYVIPAGFFAEEAEYRIVVSSVDATSATAYSDLKGLSMSFLVDRTAPSVVVGGLEEGGRYEGEEQTVKVLPSDEGGSLGHIKVLIYERDADIEHDEPILVAFDMEGEELLDHLDANSGEITFVVPEGYQQTVVIVCEDQAIGEDGGPNVCTEVYRNVTVSSDRLVIFFANKPLFYGTIAGGLGLLFFLFFLLFKRKKKEEDEAEVVTA